ncbi:MAG: Txe/YoeB family addiction module toxin [Candidatus Competibacteraceae bacterium]|nr:MAG: Txe/YoeB family addiction module toxin [Candidatus Competibacteraceae bacterium]
MKVKFMEGAWTDYLSWQSDKAMLRKINRLIHDIQRSPFEGIGKPEPLRHQLSGQWSRRIDEMNRIVYIVENDEITILQCGRHYSPH